MLELPQAKLSPSQMCVSRKGDGADLDLADLPWAPDTESCEVGAGEAQGSVRAGEGKLVGREGGKVEGDSATVPSGESWRMQLLWGHSSVPSYEATRSALRASE